MIMWFVHLVRGEREISQVGILLVFFMILDAMQFVWRKWHFSILFLHPS